MIMGKPIKLTGSQLQEFLDDYSYTDMSCREICAKYNIATCTYYIYLERNKDKIIKRNWHYNETCFSVYSPEANYWAGFIAADGCVSHKNTVSIALQANDADHLNKFLLFVGGTSNLYHYQKGNIVRAQANCDTILFDLEKNYNISRKKSFTYDPPEVLCNDRDFWRGMIDGDGCISLVKSKDNTSKCPSFYLCGNFNTVTKFHKYIQQFVVSKAVVYQDSKCPQIYYSRFGGGNIVKTILEVLYKDSCVSLDRKYKLAEFICNKLYIITP